MSVKKMLDRIVSPRLIEYGFRYSGKEGPMRWVYSRKQGEIEQQVTFQKSHYANNLWVDVITSIQRPPHPVKLASDTNERNWLYDDEQSLEKLLIFLVDLIIKKGIPTLELMSIPDMKPKEDLTREILIDTESKAQAFAESHKLSYDHVKENLIKTEKILLESKLSSKEIDWELILLSGAYVGELIRINLGGSWIWDEEFSTCFVVNIRGQSTKAIDPLTSVVNFWQKPTMIGYKLTEEYEQLL